MVSKSKEKYQAILLRKRGFSYSEIRRKVPVSKSSLSLWFKGLSLDKKATAILYNKLMEVQKLGAQAKRQKREVKETCIKRKAIRQIHDIGNKELFLLGLMLYWAEGSKIREGNISQRVAFTNSDLRMCRLFLKWVKQCLKIVDSDITLSVYIHDSYRGSEEKVVEYWSKQMEISRELFKKVSFTKTNFSKSNKRDRSENYHGQLRIVIKKSVDINRKIAGWIEGVCIQTGVI